MRPTTSLSTSSFRRPSAIYAGSINSVCFAPEELGLIFAAASSDGNVSVHTCDEGTGTWSVAMVQNEGGLPAHPLGATCVSFAPAMEAGALTSARTSKVLNTTADTSGFCQEMHACESGCQLLQAV
jgi:hypothetical protein